MHSYAIDTGERTWYVVALGVLAIVVSALCDRGLAACHMSVPWYVGTPTPLALFGALYTLFDHWAWRTRIATVQFSRVPDVRGTWAGTLSTLRDGEDLVVPVTCFIRQTWLRLSLELQTETSRSSSTIAAFDVAGHARPELTYAYLNEPTAVSDGTLHTHRGTACLRVSSDSKDLDGSYYTGRGRGSIGTLQMTLKTRRINTNPQHTNLVALPEASHGA
jgi:hypothetical protein